MRLKLFVFASMLAGLLAGTPQTSRASDAVYATIPDGSVVGRGTLSYAFWDVYDVTLVAPRGQWRQDKPFALSITYHRAFSGKDIAERSVQEIRKQGFSDEARLAHWKNAMQTLFPDVTPGMTLTAVYQPNQKTIFYQGNRLIGTIKDELFGPLFFDIWLSEKTSEPDLRRALLGSR